MTSSPYLTVLWFIVSSYCLCHAKAYSVVKKSGEARYGALLQAAKSAMDFSGKRSKRDGYSGGSGGGGGGRGIQELLMLSMLQEMSSGGSAVKSDTEAASSPSSGNSFGNMPYSQTSFS
ncbi:hypothetical protein RvY_00163 [Ramazzottius varieornatus]|uniref:Uncharacterized protein n=1 Tax=Ramazzottius varieornatus TaxID=947166 RepID=A0A1D1UBS5_RAMVA|nr:hypothetical protein RvY_00163 [Ramazzottius varieornatus]